MTCPERGPAAPHPLALPTNGGGNLGVACHCEAGAVRRGNPGPSGSPRRSEVDRLAMTTALVSLPADGWAVQYVSLLHPTGRGVAAAAVFWFGSFCAFGADAVEQDGGGLICGTREAIPTSGAESLGAGAISGRLLLHWAVSRSLISR